MNFDDIIRRVAHQKKCVSDVLQRYIVSHHCPCHWPQFEYWVGKPQGPGWQDEIQNDVIEAAVALPSFVRTPPACPEYGLEEELQCSNCGTKWKHFSEEWRMLAFRHILVRVGPQGSSALAPRCQLIGANVFATLGHEPAATTLSLTLGQWTRFMEGKRYMAVPFFLTRAKEAGLAAFFWKIINAFRSRG